MEGIKDRQRDEHVTEPVGPEKKHTLQAACRYPRLAAIAALKIRQDQRQQGPLIHEFNRLESSNSHYALA